MSAFSAESGAAEPTPSAVRPTGVRADADRTNQTSLTSHWVGKGFWGMLDMGLFAGGNFLTHVFLARWLSEPAYGTFTTAFAIYLLLAVVHTSVMIEPMMVYGSKRYRRRLPHYLGDLVRMHGKLCAVYAAVMLAVAGVEVMLGEARLAWALSAFAFAQFTLLLPWVLRDACYVKSDPKPAGLAGIIYVASVLVGLFTLRALGALSLASAILVLGGAALLANVWLIHVLGLWKTVFTLTPRWRAARIRHWRFGRWSLLSNFIRYVPEHLPMILVPVVVGYAVGKDAGFATGGALKALITLVTPFVLVTWALSNLMLPLLVRRAGTPAFEAMALRVALLVAAGPLLAWPVLGLFGEPIVGLLFDGKFVDQAWVLWILGALPVLISVNCILFAMFRALDRPALLLPCTIAAAITMVVVGLPMLWWFGLWGMVVGMLTAQLVQSVALGWMYMAKLHREAVGGARPHAKSNSAAFGSNVPDPVGALVEATP